MKALVLSGGGSKGAYEVGALKYLLVDLCNKYDLVAGVSVGALNAAFLAMFPVGQEVQAYKALEDLWNGLDNSKVYKTWFPLSYIETLWKPSVFNSKPLQDTVHAKLDPKKVLNSGRKLRVGATGLDTGEYKVFDETYPNIQDAVLASSAFPAMLLPISLEGQLWTDGGVRSITPLKAAIQAGATEIDVVLCSPAGDKSKAFTGKTTALAVAARAIDLMCDQIEENDLVVCDLVNQLVAAGKAPDKKFISIRIVRPDSVLADNALDFTPSLLQKMQKVGYEDAKRILGG